MNETMYDVTIVGGGGAGLTAAQQLGRMGRSVLLIDGGSPRNARAAHMHGFPGFDGASPNEFLRRARADLDVYDVTLIDETVDQIESLPGPRITFAVTTRDGRVARTRRVLVTTGLTDVLPDIPGLRERWGHQVIHCPWCHGYEVKGERIGIIDTGFGAHQALLFAQLSNDVILIGGNPASDRPSIEIESLRRAGVTIDERDVRGVVDIDGDGVRLLLSDGGVLDVGAAVVGSHFDANVGLLRGLTARVADHPTGFGTSLETDVEGQTTHRGVYAAGNVIDPMQQVLHACANGSTVAGSIVSDLLAEEAVFGPSDPVLANADQSQWDEIYDEHDEMWSGQPNGSVVVEIAGVAPRRALDVGCGEGADAIWLAQKGWQVTAVDISATAIVRARRAGESAEVEVAWQRRDLIDEPIGSEGYELVSVSYPAFTRSRAGRVAAQLVDAVAPGGEFLFIGHDLTDHEPTEHDVDPSQYVIADAFKNALHEADFAIVVDEIRERPNAPVGAHHSKDQILRARRP